LASWEESASHDPPISGLESPALGLPIYVPITEKHIAIRRRQMERPQDRDLPTLTANTERLRRQLEQLHASVKDSGADRPKQDDQAESLGMVIRGT
jgi:hypothetical protein